MTAALHDDMTARWRPSAEQVALADDLLRAGWDRDRGGERGVWTLHLLVNKEHGWWTADVEVTPVPDAVFTSREAALRALAAIVDAYHVEHPDTAVSGGYTWHPRPGEAAVFEDILARWPR